MKETAKRPAIATFRGHNGEMSFDGEAVTVANNNAMKFNRTGPLVIPLESVESVQLKKPTMTHSNGHIRIATPGNGPAELTLHQASTDDKTIMVLLGKNGSARKFADLVMEAVAARGVAALPFISEADTRTEFRGQYGIPEDAILAVGVSGYCSLDGSHVSILRFPWLVPGSGVKRIPLDSITAIRIRPAKGVLPGVIQFTVPGTSDRTLQHKGTTVLHHEENSVSFNHSQEASFIALRDAIEAAHSDRRAPAGPTQFDVLEQITRLAELRDAGIVTAEEFEAKKAELLARL